MLKSLILILLMTSMSLPALANGIKYRDGFIQDAADERIIERKSGDGGDIHRARFDSATSRPVQPKRYIFADNYGSIPIPKKHIDNWSDYNGR